MRFFNLDLHVAVIADIKQIFESLGHEVTDWSISDHTWVFGRQRDVVDIVNRDTWKQIDKSMCDAFYERYQKELESFDAFIVTHTPCFAMLYERWNKPIICVASTRYEQPFSDNPEAWQELNDYLVKQIDAGKVIPVANNQYDADYAEAFTHRTWQVIPSICDYTKAPYRGNSPSNLFYSKSKNIPSIDGLLGKEEFFKPTFATKVFKRLGFPLGKRGFDWTDLAKFRSVVYMPYNASIMSIFEMYTSGMPMLFPSQRFAKELMGDYKNTFVFSELSFNQVKGLPSKSSIPLNGLDPNNYEDEDSMRYWIAKSDFYDHENMKGLIYFDSFEDLREKLRIVAPNKVSSEIQSHAQFRAEQSRLKWASVIQNLQTR